MGKSKEEKAEKKAKKEEEEDEEPKVKLSKEEKAAKKAAKEAKNAKREGKPLEDEPAKKKAKKADSDDEDEPKEKLSKEEKAAKKAAKAAKKAAAEGSAPPSDFAPPKAEAAAPPAAAADELNRLFVGNLPFKMTEEWMKDEFKVAGTVHEIDWLMHADTGKWKGAVFMTMGSAAEAAAAVQQLNGKDCEGRAMKVEVALPRKGGAAGAGRIVEENPPSESVFLGNLPWTVDEHATRELFKDCGEILKLKWLEKDGEFRGMGFIDFDSVESATKAVALAGSDLGGRPIRINFSKPKVPNQWGDAGGGSGKPQRPSKPMGEKPEGCVELFCGNLPWSIDEAKITQFFGKSGATVTGTRWLNDKETGEFKGIGFVTFADSADVDKAVTLGGEQLEGRPIRIDYAGQKKKEGAWQGGGGW